MLESLYATFNLEGLKKKSMATNSGIFTFGDTIGNAGGFRNYNFGQDSGGFYIAGTTVGQDKLGNIFNTGTGKKYLGGSVNDLTGPILDQYNAAMGINQPNDNTYKAPTTNSLLDTTSQDAAPIVSMQSVPSSPADLVDQSQFNTPTDTSGGQVAQQPSTVPGNYGTPGSIPPIQSSIGGGTTTTINPTHYSNGLNYLGYRMLSPQDLKRGLTAGQGLGTTQSAGNLTNPALVTRQSLLGR